MLKHFITAAMILAGGIPLFAADDLGEIQSPRIFPLTDVCEDVILIIASYGTARDCINLASTCKSFHDLIDKNPTIWREYLSRIPGSTHPKLKGPEDEHPKDKFIRLMQPQFWLLTKLNGDYTLADISDNGLWAVGVASDNILDVNPPGFILNVKTGTKEILDFDPVGVTNEGEVFGNYKSASTWTAVIWTSEAGKQPLPSLNGYTMNGIQGISPNGRWIVGHSDQDSLIWDREAKTIKAVEAVYWKSFVSNNGVAIHGSHHEITRYISGRDIESLPLPENCTVAWLLGITSDGSGCVGATTRPDRIPILWDQREDGKWQTTLLRGSGGNTWGQGNDISDNKIVVGEVRIFDGEEYSSKGFFWTQETDMISLQQLLGDRFPQDYGTYNAKKITRDGVFILGSINIISNTFAIPIGSEDGAEIQNSSLYLAYIPDFKAYRALGITPPFIKPILKRDTVIDFSPSSPPT